MSQGGGQEGSKSPRLAEAMWGSALELPSWAARAEPLPSCLRLLLTLYLRRERPLKSIKQERAEIVKEWSIDISVGKPDQGSWSRGREQGDPTVHQDEE